MASLELLTALSTGSKTIADVASELRITHDEAVRQLRAATASDLIMWEANNGWFTDVEAEQWFAHLSTAGLEEQQRLLEATADR